ncbi:MAG: hypothetical protein DRH08_05060 [Deltaproteobacteria bacterium]|nr:MAG: hypothetical protein DRH08_05060 [Deltaproteobacteria bacterium]
MKIRKITVARGRTINTGNFNSKRFEYSVEVELEKEEPVQKVRLTVNEMIDEWLDEDEAALNQ